MRAGWDQWQRRARSSLRLVVTYSVLYPYAGPFTPVPLLLIHSAGHSSITGLRRTPISAISTSTQSPAFIHNGGLRREPTPAGVPVAMQSPGISGVMRER